MIDLGNHTLITLVADAGTPAGYTGYAGIRIPIPQGVALPANGVQDALRVTVGGSDIVINGYARDGAGSKEWVMTPAVDPNIAALNAIPGPQGWSDQSAKAVYANLGGALLGMGVPGAQVRTGFQQLYMAAVANHVAANS